MEKAIFAAGCFWGVEAAFRKLEGVTASAVGYTGGRAENPSYPEVCKGETGHAEAVMVTFDPEKISYEKLLDVFWEAHDPTSLNRQGADRGAQYRSAIFYANPEQEAAAKAAKARREASGQYHRPIVTELAPASTFWLAEDYHQQYFEKQGRV